MCIRDRSKPLPLSRYTIREVKSPEHYGINEQELTAYLEHEGDVYKRQGMSRGGASGMRR